MNFDGKGVLITGSSRGIGKAAARAFLERGARVAINGTSERSVAAAIAELGDGDRMISAPGDVATATGCEKMVNRAIGELGRLDVLVNNAGIFREAPVETFDEDAWDRMLDINLKGAFFCTVAALPALRESRGNIVNVASESGLIGNLNCAVYCASKGGLVMMSRALALEFAPEVRVNCVCPGAVDTEMTQEAAAQTGDAAAYLHALEDYYPLKRIATAGEVAGTILYLASGDASFITGAALAVDGGSSAG